MARILTGIQATGQPHLGNFFGAMLPFISGQGQSEGFAFIADLHALNQVQDPEKLRTGVREAALSWLAAGLDLSHTVLFAQSAVPAHAELAALLLPLMGVGQLERSHAYKDAAANGKQLNAGTFTYPVLMAADILLYEPEIVPVGADQQQHLEYVRDLAGRLESAYGVHLRTPAAATPGELVPGIDGRKMSKSYGNAIPLFASPAEIESAVAHIPTDSLPMGEPRDLGGSTVAALYRLVGPDFAEFAARYSSGSIGHREAKQLLAAALERYIAPMRARRSEWEPRVDDVLSEGAERARMAAAPVLLRVQAAMGLC